MKKSTYFHLSEIYNRDSIFEKGLLPSKIPLLSHLEGFRDLKLITKDEDKLLYSWQDCERNEKFTKDMIYCSVWINPRNKYVGDADIKKYTTCHLYFYDQMIFDVYEISDMNNIPSFNISIYHEQSPGGRHSSLYQMDDKYAHDDKVLGLSKRSETNIKIVGQAVMCHTKHGYDIKVLKNVRYN